MQVYSTNINNFIKSVDTNLVSGLDSAKISRQRTLYGSNRISKQKGRSIFLKITDALLEPMMLILIFAWVLTLGVNIGKFIKTGELDFIECIGILVAIVLSVAIELIMEKSSERAFKNLNSIYEHKSVIVVRNGEERLVAQEDLVVGDIVVLNSGDKIFADGRLIESESLRTNEATLTGESTEIEKNSKIELNEETPLSERKNMVYSGTYVCDGKGKMVITAVGDNTEMGKLFKSVLSKKEIDSPLNQKMSILSKRITILGVIATIIVFIISITKLYLSKSLTFINLQEAFISAVVLIVAAVPEGLPTMVAVSLALNMIKLSKENALIKKMVATETAGAVSVICTDKTGTLTENKMSVVKIFSKKELLEEFTEQLKINFVVNNSAEIVKEKNKTSYVGSGSETALLKYYESRTKQNYKVLKNSIVSECIVPFKSENKYMITSLKHNNGYTHLLKGAREVVLLASNLEKEEKNKIVLKMQEEELKGNRVMAFAHKESSIKTDALKNYEFDGFVVLKDKLRKEVYEAIKISKKAGIKVKILTGDNKLTATTIARELDLIDGGEIVEGESLEKISDIELKKRLNNIVVIARSTPLIKLRVVKLLKEMNEVVAVTGDGINDAPALRHADVGFSMGKSGSEIAKEASDVVLIDDSFTSVIKAINFGRNVYKNIQRFILFQLTVNMSAVLFIILSVIFNFGQPFNTLQLLWINIIMDGPPALTLGLGKTENSLEKAKPIKRDTSIVNKNMFIKITINGIAVSLILILQTAFNFLQVPSTMQSSVVFTMFILMQLFNAFNCQELGSASIFKKMGKNKVMLLAFGITFLMHILIVQVFNKAFGLVRLDVLSWVKVISVSLLIVIITEVYKIVYRQTKRIKEQKNK